MPRLASTPTPLQVPNTPIGMSILFLSSLSVSDSYAHVLLLAHCSCARIRYPDAVHFQLPRIRPRYFALVPRVYFNTRAYTFNTTCTSSTAFAHTRRSALCKLSMRMRGNAGTRAGAGGVGQQGGGATQRAGRGWAQKQGPRHASHMHAKPCVLCTPSTLTRAQLC